MAIRTYQNRMIAPLILGAVLALIGTVTTRTPPTVRIERLGVDPAAAPRFVLESLEGMGTEGARRIEAARKGLVAIDSPDDLTSIPGVGTRLLHRWHPDLAFATERP